MASTPTRFSRARRACGVTFATVKTMFAWFSHGANGRLALKGGGGMHKGRHLRRLPAPDTTERKCAQLVFGMPDRETVLNEQPHHGTATTTDEVADALERMAQRLRGRGGVG